MNETKDKNQIRYWFLVGTLLAAISVILGAFGAHGLENALQDAVEDPQKSVANWTTATRYQMYHSIGIILVAISIATFGKKTEFTVAAICFSVGILLFSGLLYALSLTDIKILGAIVPLGGLSLIIGWVSFAVGAWRIS